MGAGAALGRGERQWMTAAEVQMRSVSGWSVGAIYALVFGLSGLIAADVLAQETREITLQEAIKTAVERNVTFIQAADRVASSKASVSQAVAQFLPNLTASASGSRAYSNRPGATSGPSFDATSSSVSAGVSSGMTLFDGLGNFNSLRAAQFGLAADRWAYERERQTVVFQTASSFLTVLMNRELVESQQENLDAQRQQLAMIQEFYKAGSRSLADLLQQQAAVAQAELQELNAEETEGVSKLQLLKTMGLEPTVGYDAVPLPVDHLKMELEPPDPDSTLRAALAYRADLAGRRAQVQAASKKLWVTRSGYWPSLSLSVSGGTSYSGEGKSGTFSAQMWETSPRLSIGLSFGGPIFDRLQTRTSVKQAQIALRDQRLNLEDLERQVILDVRQALLGYQTAVKRLRAAEAQLQYAKEALAATTERYRVGASTLVELAASRAQYANARTGSVQAGYNVVIAWLAVGYYKGDIDAALKLLG